MQPKLFGMAVLARVLTAQAEAVDGRRPTDSVLGSRFTWQQIAAPHFSGRSRIRKAPGWNITQPGLCASASIRKTAGQSASLRCDRLSVSSGSSRAVAVCARSFGDHSFVHVRRKAGCGIIDGVVFVKVDHDPGLVEHQNCILALLVPLGSLINGLGAQRYHALNARLDD